jgi:hypothetical protein
MAPMILIHFEKFAVDHVLLVTFVNVRVSIGRKNVYQAALQIKNSNPNAPLAPLDIFAHRLACLNQCCALLDMSVIL